jgi:hypothetical protein
VLKPLLKLFLYCVSLCLSGQCLAQQNDIGKSEYQLKTVYLLHFAELTEWPELSPTSICLLGKSPLEAYLPALQGQKVNNMALSVILDQQHPIEDCQILVLGELTLLNKALLQQAKTQHILLVSDAENFAAQGGMIQFSLRDNKLKLVVNLNSVKQANLKLSSKLLRMTEILE